jgi:hypothetical protein
MPGWMEDPVQGYQELPKCWDNLRKLVTRQYRWFSYAAFCEEQPKKRHMVHLHVITRTNLPTRLNEIAVHCGFGFEASNSLMTGSGASYYVAKYASKSLQFAPHHFRRVRISQEWPRLPLPDLPLDYLPMERKESLQGYIARAAGTLGFDVQTLQGRYDNHAIDIGQ